MHNPSPGESVREYYRKQGEVRMAEIILKELEELLAYNTEANWSPRYIISVVRGIHEARKLTDQRTNA
jgi:hypothetical protein